MAAIFVASDFSSCNLPVLLLYFHLNHPAGKKDNSNMSRESASGQLQLHWMNTGRVKQQDSSCVTSFHFFQWRQKVCQLWRYNVRCVTTAHVYDFTVLLCKSWIWHLCMWMIKLILHLTSVSLKHSPPVGFKGGCKKFENCFFMQGGGSSPFVFRRVMGCNDPVSRRDRPIWIF